MEHAVVIEDFLPSPAEFVKRIKKEKITISIDQYSLELYKALCSKTWHKIPDYDK